MKWAQSLELALLLYSFSENNNIPFTFLDFPDYSIYGNKVISDTIYGYIFNNISEYIFGISINICHYVIAIYK